MDYVHVLLFQCPKCNGPIAYPSMSLGKPETKEELDKVLFSAPCPWPGCNWDDGFSGTKRIADASYDWPYKIKRMG